MSEYFKGRLGRVSHLITRELGTDEWIYQPMGDIEQTRIFEVHTHEGFTHSVFIGGYVDSTPQLLNEQTGESIFLRESND
jgi:hypothetical protein